MRRTFCNKCGTETYGWTVTHEIKIEYTRGNGTQMEEEWKGDLCDKCMKEMRSLFDSTFDKVENR